MPHVSRPLIALLVGTVAFFALWIVALKPSRRRQRLELEPEPRAVPVGDHQAPPIRPSTTARRRQRHARAATSTTPTRRPRRTPAPTPAQLGRRVAAPRPPRGHDRRRRSGRRAVLEAGRPRPAAAAARRRNPLAASRSRRSRCTHKVVALLFYNPAGADDRAVKQELGAVPAHGGRVVKLAVPLASSRATRSITNQVPVTRLADARADRPRAAGDDDRRVRRSVRDRPAGRDALAGQASARGRVYPRAGGPRSRSSTI